MLVFTGGCIVFEVVFDTVVADEGVTAVSVLDAEVVTVLEEFGFTEVTAVDTELVVGIDGLSELIVASFIYKTFFIGSI